MNQQKAGLMAQEAGQMVVPASGPGRNNTPQPMSGGPGQNQAGSQQAPSQGGRPQHQQQPFNMQQNQQMQMDQAAAKTQAQIRAQAHAKQMQGQPGGLGGPAQMSQSPAMNTLNAPVQRPPVAMGQQPPMNQANLPFGQTLDPRFNQGNQRPQPGSIANRNQLMSFMAQSMTPEQQQALRNLTPDKQNEVLARWFASQRNQQMAGRPQPQPGQFGQGNPMAQFAQGANMAAPQANGSISMNTQNPALVQQHLNRMRANGVNQSSFPADPAAAGPFMDSLDIPPNVLSQISNLPPTVRKWGQLKQWMAQASVHPNTQAKLLQIQNMQVGRIMNQRAQAAGGVSLPPGVPQPQGPQGPGIGQMQPQHPNPAMQMAMHNITVTSQEIQSARAASERFSTWDDGRVRQYLVQLKQHQMKNKIMAGQQQAQPAQPNQPTAINSAPPNQTAPAPVPAAPQRAPSTTEQPVSAGPIKAQKPGSGNRSTQQQNSSPAIPQRPNKRSSDDVVEVPAPAATPVQRTPSQPSQPLAGPPKMTAAQLASLTPEQRIKYEQFIKNRQAHPAQGKSEDFERLRSIGIEIQRQSQQEVLPDVPMSPQQHAEMARDIQYIIGEMNKVGKILGRWYSLTRDDNRAKQYFTMRIRLIKQFKDGEASTQPRETFSIERSHVTEAKALLGSMAQDLKAAAAGGQRTAAAQGVMDTGQQQGTPAQPATSGQSIPLSAANLDKHNKHVRSNSRQGPPAAPTSSQPPFQIPSAPSPHGVPTYSTNNGVLELQLPNKRRKYGPGQSTGASASPQLGKQASPDAKKENIPEPQFPCPEPDCESSQFAFLTEEARRIHIQEEHVKPHENPMKFVFDAYTDSLGFGSSGNLRSDSIAAAASLGVASSRQGQAPAAAPMSRGPSMKRQESAPGPAEAFRDAVTKMPGQKPTLIKAEDDATVQQTVAEIPFQFGTIDPQDLFQNLGGLQSGGGGAISDMNVYRSVTPNDTPESSKDSASSEPTSDVSEGVALNVTLDMGFDTWQPFDGDRYMNMGLDVELDLLEANNVDMAGSSGLMEMPSWDEMQPDFTKPFALDTSLFALDTSS